MLDAGQLLKLIRALQAGQEPARREALHSLKHFEGPEWDTVPDGTITSLVESLQQQLCKSQADGPKPLLFRQEVVVILGNIGPRSEPALPQLVELLDEGVPDGLREAVAIALGKIGKGARGAVDQLIQVLNSSCRIALADKVARALGDIGCADQRVRSALVNLWLLPFHSRSNQVQIAIVLCKLKIETDGLLKNLTSTLVGHRDTSLRKAAAEALAWCSKNEVDVVPALTAALHDENEEVCRLAEAGLAQLRLTPDKAIHLCAAQLKDSIHAETALRRSGELAVAPLIEALKADEPIAREKAARTLGCIGELALAAVPALTRALKDKHLDVRLAAAKALWIITKNADVVVPVLTELLQGKKFPAPDTSESRRCFLQSIIESLCRVGPSAKAAIPVLTKKAKDENRLIRESALKALREIGPPVASVAASKKVAVR